MNIFEQSLLSGSSNSNKHSPDSLNIEQSASQSGGKRPRSASTVSEDSIDTKLHDESLPKRLKVSSVIPSSTVPRFTHHDSPAKLSTPLSAYSFSPHSSHSPSSRNALSPPSSAEHVQLSSLVLSLDHPAECGRGSTVISSSVPSNGQDDCLQLCNSRLLNNELFADVHFVLTSDDADSSFRVRVPAHRVVLASRSVVFAAMLYGHMQEVHEPHQDIEITDISPDVFLLALRYLYTDDLSFINGSNVLQLLYAAKKYELEGIRKACTNFLDRDVNVTNACSLLTAAHNFDESQLVRTLVSFIEDHADEVIKSDCSGLAELSEGALCCLLESNYLEVNEEQLISEVIKWSEVACRNRNLPVNPAHRRRVTSNIIKYLRFPLCSTKFLSLQVRSSGILSDEQVATILFHITSEGATPCEFSSKKRERWRKFVAGQSVDVLASCSYPGVKPRTLWFNASILEVNLFSQQILVHFVGYPSRCDCWISNDSDQLAPAGSRTKAKAAPMTEWCTIL